MAEQQSEFFPSRRESERKAEQERIEALAATTQIPSVIRADKSQFLRLTEPLRRLLNTLDALVELQADTKQFRRHVAAASECSIAACAYAVDPRDPENLAIRVTRQQRQLLITHHDSYHALRMVYDERTLDRELTNTRIFYRGHPLLVA